MKQLVGPCMNLLWLQRQLKCQDVGRVHSNYKIERLKSSSFANSFNCLSTYFASIVNDSPFLSVASNEISSNNFSSTVCKRRAPIFSADSFTCVAISAMRLMPSSVNCNVNPSVLIKAMYCSVNDAFGSVKIRTNSAVLSGFNSTRMGKRPCNSGTKSDGLA